MTIVSQLRARLEALIFDGFGETPHTIPIGTFRRVAGALDTPEGASERRVRIAIGLQVPRESGINPLDGFALTDRAVTVTVEYQRTDAGEDVPEGYSELLGAGTDDAIGDRMALDKHAIETALCWHEHWADLDPHVWSIRRDGVDTTFDGPIARLVVSLVVSERITQPGSYGP